MICDNPECNEVGIEVDEQGMCPKCGGKTFDITESETGQDFKNFLDNLK